MAAASRLSSATARVESAPDSLPRSKVRLGGEEEDAEGEGRRSRSKNILREPAFEAEALAEVEAVVKGGKGKEVSSLTRNEVEPEGDSMIGVVALIGAGIVADDANVKVLVDEEDDGLEDESMSGRSVEDAFVASRACAMLWLSVMVGVAGETPTCCLGSLRSLSSGVAKPPLLLLLPLLPLLMKGLLNRSISSPSTIDAAELAPPSSPGSCNEKGWPLTESFEKVESIELRDTVERLEAGIGGDE